MFGQSGTCSTTKDHFPEDLTQQSCSTASQPRMTASLDWNPTLTMGSQHWQNVRTRVNLRGNLLSLSDNDQCCDIDCLNPTISKSSWKRLSCLFLSFALLHYILVNIDISE